ncbi:MAG: HNH endonuclease [Duncaniella sp.]|uniref:HNH endonuclease n=1 Tax=Duncaniella sp. TaxID=2518496 RepID=UPI0023BFA756|nr:HNH endonuclease [Duncaniella sp.]MDE5987839.1 HNH endonuclease [Duncaniella sp.]MDE6174440.1 HNH endonuclease [Duncaniella sp.]
MRHIDRLAIPDILNRKHVEWQKNYDTRRAANPGLRPDSPKYAHKDIRKQLMSMSHCKCFYCEGLLKDQPKEVDHYIEVAVDSSKAYEWENLYMACTNCNDKIPHDDIPVTDALDPCTDSDEEIRANITFEKEVVRAVPDSAKGLKTITKFRLDTELLDARRAKWLNKINDDIFKILSEMILEGRNRLNDSEVGRLKGYMQSDSRYSLMSEIYIKDRLKRFWP